MKYSLKIVSMSSIDLGKPSNWEWFHELEYILQGKYSIQNYDMDQAFMFIQREKSRTK